MSKLTSLFEDFTESCSSMCANACVCTGCNHHMTALKNYSLLTLWEPCSWGQRWLWVTAVKIQHDSVCVCMRVFYHCGEANSAPQLYSDYTSLTKICIHFPSAATAWDQIHMLLLSNHVSTFPTVLLQLQYSMYSIITEHGIIKKQRHSLQPHCIVLPLAFSDLLLASLKRSHARCYTLHISPPLTPPLSPCRYRCPSSERKRVNKGETWTSF